MSEKEKPKHQTGHRERLRKRFMRGGEEALHDYELLELVLFRAIPRRDVKPIAKELLERFGDISAVLTAESDDLQRTKFITPAVIAEFKLISAVAAHVGQSRILHREVLNNWDAIITYCRTKLAERKVEEVRVLFMDKKARVIVDEKMGEGTVDQVAFYARNIVKRGLELSATGFILVHNHPSGDASPSRADIDITKKIRDLAQGLGMRLHDHIIIGRTSEYSFKNNHII